MAAWRQWRRQSNGSNEEAYRGVASEASWRSGIANDVSIIGTGKAGRSIYLAWRLASGVCVA